MNSLLTSGPFQASILQGVARLPPPVPHAHLAAIDPTTIQLAISASGIASAEAFGDQTVALVTVTPLATGGILGSHAVRHKFAARGHFQPSPFQAPTLASVSVGKAHFPGPSSTVAISLGAAQLFIFPLGIPSAEAFGLTAIWEPAAAGILQGRAYATLGRTSGLVVDSGISGLVRGSLAASRQVSLGTLAQPPEGPGPSPQGISVTGIASKEAFGVASATRGIILSGIGTAGAVGTPSIARGLTLQGVPSSQAFGTVKLSRSISLVGIATREAFGLPGVTVSTAPSTSIHTTGIASLQSFGVPKLSMAINATGVASGQAFGLTSFGISNKIQATGIPSGQAFGTTKLRLNTKLVGIASSAIFGHVTVTIAPPCQIIASGIPSAQAVGQVSVSAFNQQIIGLQGIPSAEAFGAPSFGLVIKVQGISSAEAFGLDETIGLPTINFGVNHTGIPSAEAFGIAQLSVEVGRVPITVDPVWFQQKPGVNYLTIPNDRFPIDLLLFRVMSNIEVDGLVESTFADPNNTGLAWQGPYPPRGAAVAFTRPVPKPTPISIVNIFS